MFKKKKNKHLIKKTKIMHENLATTRTKKEF